MKICEFPGCSRRARYLMGWSNTNGAHFGYVCATHDKELGRKNLVKAGMPILEAILFERYLLLSENLDNCPDFPEWLKEHRQ